MLRSSFAKAPRSIPVFRRSLTTTPLAHKKEGDISDSFVSLSGTVQTPLPDHFRQLKCELVRGREKEITESWVRLLRELKKENEIVAKKGPAVIPQVEYGDLESGLEGLKGEIRKRGAVVVKGVVPEGEARAYKEETEEYIKKNPSTRGIRPKCPTASLSLT